MEKYDNKVWLVNIAALELFDPQKACILSDFYSRSERSKISALNSEVESEKLRHIQGGHYILFGIGQGEILMQLLPRSDIDVLVIEPELSVIVAVLQHYDVSTALRLGKLRFLLPLLKHPAVQEIETRKCLVFLQTYIQEMQSHLIWINTGSRALNDPFFTGLEQALSVWDQQIQKIAPWLKQSYNFVFDITVVSPDCAIFDDLAHCFKRLGFNVRLCRIPDMSGTWTQEQYHDLWLELITQPSQVTIMRNRVLLENSDVKQRLSLEPLLPGRIVSWWWDVPNSATQIDLDDPQTQLPAFAFSREILNQLPYLSQWLPPAARQDFVTAEQRWVRQDEEIPVSFVGQSRFAMVANHMTVLTQVLSTFSEPQAVLLLQDIQKQQDVLIQYHYLQQHEQDLLLAIEKIQCKVPHVAYFLQYILRMLQTGMLRLAGVKMLQDHNISVKVYGDSDWVNSGIVAPENFCGTIAAESLPRLYQCSKVNLNFNFMQSASTINPKVLDIVACGAVVLTDNRPELDILYPDTNTRPFVFDNLDELPQRVSEILTLDLMAYKQRLRSYTIAQHSLESRAKLLTEVLNIQPLSTLHPEPLEQH